MLMNLVEKSQTERTRNKDSVSRVMTNRYDTMVYFSLEFY